MITKEITVFNKQEIEIGNVVFIKVKEKHRRALVLNATEKYINLIYVNSNNKATEVMVTIDQYLNDNTLIKPAHCYMK